MPVLLVGTLRPTPRTAELDTLLDDAAASGATLPRLGPLPEPEVAELVRLETGVPPTPALGEAVARAGGNPLWVVELLRAFAAEEGPGFADGGTAQAPAVPRRPSRGRTRPRPTSRCGSRWSPHCPGRTARPT